MIKKRLDIGIITSFISIYFLRLTETVFLADAKDVPDEFGQKALTILERYQENSRQERLAKGA